jgi:hypothetical protein
MIAVAIFMYLLTIMAAFGGTGQLWDTQHEVYTLPILMAGYLGGFYWIVKFWSE